MTVVDPKQQTAPDDASASAGNLTIPGKIEPPDPPAPDESTGTGGREDNRHGGRTFTTEDIEKARREEKDKLYSSIDEMKKELAAFRKAEEDRQKALAAEQQKAEAERQKAEEEARKKAEEEMTAKQLVEQRDREWQERFHQLEQENARKDEILAKERRYNELVSYRARRLEEETDTIAPQLRDLVVLGNSEQEIEASIADLQERTNRILEQITAGQAAATRSQRTTNPTSPPVGPLEAQPEFQQLSNADLAAMDIQTYAKNRDRLLGAVSQRVRERGPYGG